MHLILIPRIVAKKCQDGIQNNDNARNMQRMTLPILKTAAQAEHKKLHHEIKNYEIICIKY